MASQNDAIRTSQTTLIERDLSTALDDLGAWEHVPDDHHLIRSYEPSVRAKLDHMLRVHGERYGHQTRRLLQAWYDLLRRHANLAREARAWRAACNVIATVSWDALAASSTSSTATLNTPYSGVDFVLLDMLVPSNTQPRGRFVKLQFASIDFAQPSQTAVVYSTAAGTSGTPVQQGLDFSAFLHDKTAPDGSRKFTAWTGWAFAASAQIFLAVYNPDATYSKGYDISFLMRSSPCEYNWDTTFAKHWAREGGYEFPDQDGYMTSEWGHVVDRIHGAVLGIGQGSMFTPGASPAMAARAMHGR